MWILNAWFRFYHETLDDPKVQSLPDSLFKAWINILCLACRCGGRLPNVMDIAFSLRMSLAKTEAVITALKGKGLIDNVDGCETPHNWHGRQFQSDLSTARVKRFRNAQRNVSETASATPPEQIQNRTDTDTPTVPSRTKRSLVEYSGGFLSFWNAYPRRVGKGAAAKAWKAAKPDEELTLKILSALEEAKASPQWRRDNGQFIPHPSTWLNQRRWEDEPPSPKNGHVTPPLVPIC